MANPDRNHEDIPYDFDAHQNPYYQSQAWPLPIEEMESLAADPRTNITPIQTNMASVQQTAMIEQAMMENWRFQQMHQQQLQQHQHQHQHQQHQHQHQHQQSQHHLEFDQSHNDLGMAYAFNLPIPQNPSMIATTQPTLMAGLSLDQGYVALPPGMENMHAWGAELQTELVNSATQDMGVAVSPYQPPSHSHHSPTGSHIEVSSIQSSGDDGSWAMIDRSSFDLERPFFVDPTNTLYDPPLSEQSFSEPDQHVLMHNVDIPSSAPTAYSPTSYSESDDWSCHPHHGSESHVVVSRPLHPAAIVRPIAIPPSSKNSSPDRSPASAGSAGSPGRRPSKKSPISAKNSDNRVSKKTASYDKTGTEVKRVGKRKGPLKPEQRKQAGEIRKLRACLRCKFLKKTCDKGDPCSGCQPSHARLWQVPCTRIDIKEIGYFLKDRKFDFERHVSLGFSAWNIKGYSDQERVLYITHGYGHVLPVKSREVYIRDDNCLKMDWVEANRDPNGYEVSTARLSAGYEGISTTLLSDYLDKHIDGNGTFESFVNEYFEGTLFLSDMLKTAYRFYERTSSKVIKKALKLILAYNLTLHITMVEGHPPEEKFVGKIEDESSKFYGKTMAPVMINFQIKVAMSDMWRELHKDVLEELSTLYSSVYSGDKLKNWPTIFMLAAVLLAVWECMQFDCHYRVPDESSVNKFCSDMETTPVGVIVGLFSAISQKLPSILEWDTNKHHKLLGSNPDVCDTMSEVRDHVTFHENYLRERPSAKFDSKDFDSLSNKFLSRLVLRDIRVN